MKPVPAKSVIKAATQSMLTYMNETWKLKDAEHSDYISTMTCRIANVTHVVQQAKLKRPSPKWYQQWFDDGEAGSEAVPALPAGAAAVQYEYEWDEELKTAYRFRAGERISAQNSKDIAVDLMAAQTEHDPIIAKFADGTMHPIASMTTQRYNELHALQEAGAGAARSDEHYWQGEHSASKHRLVV